MGGGGGFGQPGSTMAAGMGGGLLYGFAYWGMGAWRWGCSFVGECGMRVPLLTIATRCPLGVHPIASTDVLHTQ